MSEVLEPSASAGANNGKYIYCEAFDERKKYFVCLHTIGAIERGSVKENSPSSRCMRACEGGKCTAKGYQKEELDAGKAIYFELDPYHANPRRAQERPMAAPKVRPSIKSYRPARPSLGYESKSLVSDMPPVDRKPVAAKPKNTIENVDYGKLVTDLAASETKAEAVKKVVVETAKPVVAATQTTQGRLPGETLIEMAKRLMKEKQK